MKQKIKENKDLVRDTSSNAIINTNREELERAKARKARKLNDKSRLDALEDKVDRLTELLEKLVD